ncbi:hypothetical protein QF205_15310 [Luteimonas composti]|uniref:Uncharacterized protein n=1 Tax=Luteimonas composti TaxID=398257 RepID=A0ABT6MVE0_9GAMM|nr:hypothetical protein [Luteimonas composti]MDH7454428.1 hypothetical protein [Luteimonas composti]
MNLYAGLLFNQGHVQDVETARMLSEAPGPAPAPAAGEGPPATARPGTREDAARLLQGRGRVVGVELWAALLSAFR